MLKFSQGFIVLYSIKKQKLIHAQCKVFCHIIIRHRRQLLKKIILLLVGLSLILGMSSCADDPSEKKMDERSITLATPISMFMPPGGTHFYKLFINDANTLPYEIKLYGLESNFGWAFYSYTTEYFSDYESVMPIKSVNEHSGLSDEIGTVTLQRTFYLLVIYELTGTNNSWYHLSVTKD